MEEDIHTTFQPTNLFSQPCHRTEVPLSCPGHTWMGSSCSGNAPQDPAGVKTQPGGSPAQRVSYHPSLGRNEGSEPSRGYSTLFIPPDVCAVAPLEKHLCFQTGSTTSHLSPNQWDLAQHTGIWCSRHSLVFWVQTTFGNSCYLHKNPSVFTCKPIFHSHMVLPRHKCHSTSARPHFNMLTTHIPHLPEQNPPSSAWTKKIPYPSSILSQLPQEQARIWLTWVHACVHWEF